MRTAATRRSTATRSSCSSSATRSRPGWGPSLPKETLGARLATRLAKATHRSVHLTTAARVGSESSMLAGQLAGLAASYRPDVAVVVVGGNDVTHRVPVGESVRHLEEAIVTLRGGGAAVVVGTCPDLGALRRCRAAAGPRRSRASRQLGASPGGAPRSAAGRTPSRCAASSGPFFINNPDEMFSLDRFHPSAIGYPAPPRRSCPRCWPRSAWRTTCRTGTGPRGPRRPIRRPDRRPIRWTRPAPPPSLAG